MNSTPDAYELHPAQVPGGVMLTKRTEGEKNEHGGGEDDDDDEFVGSRDGPSRSSVDFDDLVSGLDFGDGDGEGDGAVGGDFQVTTRRLGEPDMPRAGGGASSRASTYRETADEIQRTREARIARDSMPGTWRPGRGAAAAANADVAPYGMNMEARGSGSGSARLHVHPVRRDVRVRGGCGAPPRSPRPGHRISRDARLARSLDLVRGLSVRRRSRGSAAARARHVGLAQPPRRHLEVPPHRAVAFAVAVAEVQPGDEVVEVDAASRRSVARTDEFVVVVVFAAAVLVLLALRSLREHHPARDLRRVEFIGVRGGVHRRQKRS